MKKLFFIISVFVLSVTGLNAQCNEKLLEKAKEKLTEEETLINEYKIKLDAATIDQPAPVAKFSQKFEEGKRYRLRIISDKEEFGTEGILKLFAGNRILGMSYNEKANRHYTSFDFICKKTENYKILVTFQDGKTGCAVALVSEVK